MTERPDNPAAPPDIPPVVAWASRHGGVLILLTILAAALIEGIGLYGRAVRDARPAEAASPGASAAPAADSPPPASRDSTF